MLKGKLTYSGLAVTGVALVLGWLGIADDGSAAELVRVGGEFIGLLLATYGRYRATKAA